MYYVIKNGPNIHLGVDANGAIETIATFNNSPTLKVRDLAILADEMVAVLNRDLENRANDIAATPENIATSDKPKGWREHVEEYRQFGGCTDKECTACPPGRMTKEKFVLNDEENLWSPDPEFNSRWGPIWAADGSGMYESRTSGELYLKQRFHQEEPPEMPHASDNCGSPDCPTCSENAKKFTAITIEPDYAMDHTGLPDPDEDPEHGR